MGKSNQACYPEIHDYSIGVNLGLHIFTELIETVDI